MEYQYDIIVIGAGASGIAAGYRIQSELPDARYVILEGRDTLGGTWNFFKYPGLRSDSYLTSFGFKWRPWREEKDIAEAPAIQKYLEESAAEQGIDKHIFFKHKVTGAHWSSKESMWTVEAKVNGAEETKKLEASFILTCSGYYDYEKPLETQIPGLSNFKGTVVHPQFWPKDLDYSNKRIVIVGSGATAVTLLPVLAKTAAKVTMLQRSPSYVMSLPASPFHISILRTLLPRKLADSLNFWKDVLYQQAIKSLSFAIPDVMRKMMIGEMAKALKGTNIPVDPHFTPSYTPWQQRVCLSPDGDFYDALRKGNCDIVTDHIDTVTESGIVTKSGQTIDADIVVTATGLKLLLLGGIDFTVDGERVKVPEIYAWRSFMLEGVPNVALVIGYTEMSWTLGSDIGLRTMMRVIKHMKQIGAVAVTPKVENREALTSDPIIGMNSTYFVVARDILPRKGNVDPWKERKGYLFEWFLQKFGSISSVTKGLEFSMPQTNGYVNGHANGKANGHAKAD